MKKYAVALIMILFGFSLTFSGIYLYGVSLSEKIGGGDFDSGENEGDIDNSNGNEDDEEVSANADIAISVYILQRTSASSSYNTTSVAYFKAALRGNKDDEIGWSNPSAFNYTAASGKTVERADKYITNIATFYYEWGWSIAKRHLFVSQFTIDSTYEPYGISTGNSNDDCRTKSYVTYYLYGTGSVTTSVETAKANCGTKLQGTYYFTYRKIYKNTYNLNGGSGISTSQTTYAGIGFNLYGTPTRTGYTFGGWQETGSGLWEAGKTFPDAWADGNKTFTAQWTANTYTISYNNNTPNVGMNLFNKSSVEGSNISYDSSTNSFYATANDNNTNNRFSHMKVQMYTNGSYDYQFVTTTSLGVNTAVFTKNSSSTHLRFGFNGNLEDKTFLINISGLINGTYSLQFELVSYSTTYGKFSNMKIEPGGSATNYSPPKFNVKFDSTYGTLDTPTRANYNFLGWYKGQVFTNNYYNQGLTSTSYRINAGNTSSGTYFQVGRTVVFDISYNGTLNAPDINDVMLSKDQFTIVNGNRVYGSYTITSSNLIGTYSFIDLNFSSMTNNSFTVNLFEVVDFNSSSDKVSSTSKINMTQNHALHAKWELTTYKLTVNYYSALVSNSTNLNISASGCVVGSSSIALNSSTTISHTYSATSSYTITFTRASTSYNYYLKVGGIPTTSSSLNTTSYSWTPTGNSTINVYVYQRYTISFSANAGTGTLPSTVYKIHGTNATIPTNTLTRTSYTANGWNTNSSGTGTSYTTIYSANANATLYANWTPKYSTIKVQIMTAEDGKSFQDSVAGGTVSVSYYTSANNNPLLKTDGVATTSSLTTISSAVLINYSVSFTPNVKTGYIFMGISTSFAPPSSTNAPIKTFTPTTSGTTYTINVFFKKVSKNIMKYDGDTPNISSIRVDRTETSSANYGFELNQQTGFYESQNQGIDNSYAYCKLVFNVEAQFQEIVFDVIYDAEYAYDVALFGNLNTELEESSYVEDDSQIYKKFYEETPDVLIHRFSYILPSGENFICIKYVKDGSSSSGNDSLMFHYSFSGGAVLSTDLVGIAEYSSFVLNDDGYFESQIQGQDGNVAMSILWFTLEQDSIVVFDTISSSEINFDFGMFGAVDDFYSLANPGNPSYAFQSLQGMYEDEVFSFSMDVPAGEHWIVVSYKKDGSASSGRDSLQFKYSILNQNVTDMGEYNYGMPTLIFDDTSFSYQLHSDNIWESYAIARYEFDVPIDSMVVIDYEILADFEVGFGIIGNVDMELPIDISYYWHEDWAANFSDYIYKYLYGFPSDFNFGPRRENIFVTGGSHFIDIMYTKFDYMSFEDMFKFRIGTFSTVNYASIDMGQNFSYGFKMNSNGFYESNNKGVQNSYAMCKVTFTATSTSYLNLDVINYAESNFDYGIFSELNKTLSGNNYADSTNVYKSFKGQSSSSISKLQYLVPIGTHFIYVKFIKDGSSDVGFDSLSFKLNYTPIKLDGYFYFEDGEYPQTYVGTTMNNTLTGAITGATTPTYSLMYNTGTGENIKLPVYTYGGQKYAALTSPRTQTLKLSGVSYTFTQGVDYFFKVEPIRWRVSEYGVTETQYPSGWSNYGTYKENFVAVSDKVLGFSAMHNGTVSEGWSWGTQNVNNSDETRSKLFEASLTNSTNVATEFKSINYSTEIDVFGNVGSNEKVTTKNILYSGSLVASMKDINANLTDKRAKASDMVGFYFGINGGDYVDYWTRNLGDNLNNGLVVTRAGVTTSRYLNSIYGVRLSLVFAEGSRI